MAQESSSVMQKKDDEVGSSKRSFSSHADDTLQGCSADYEELKTALQNLYDESCLASSQKIDTGIVEHPDQQVSIVTMWHTSCLWERLRAICTLGSHDNQRSGGGGGACQRRSSTLTGPVQRCLRTKTPPPMLAIRHLLHHLCKSTEYGCKKTLA